ncbi:MAG TPA: hypothetical protein VNM71_05590, partial [Steroidobacteraceae bacterium]|nr:hypothetical protein [Steroidobacteraceae bacterium]
NTITVKYGKVLADMLFFNHCNSRHVGFFDTSGIHVNLTVSRKDSSRSTGARACTEFARGEPLQPLVLRQQSSPWLALRTIATFRQTPCDSACRET